MKKTILLLACALLGTVATAASSVTDVNAQSVTQKGTYAQVSSDVAQVYDKDGNKTDVALDKNSTWQVAKTQSINGSDYYQVSTNGFLSTKDSFAYKNRRMTIKVQSLDGSDKNVNVYDHNLVQRNDIQLAPNSKWATDTEINYSNGVPFLRVAPDQYVAMYDVVEQSFSATI
ncbi:SLAP domain-containing protein [Companilactobacillus zhachilii]|uniref:SLAP domain-containing protein n=1 Tax=Companilactobacillus zhachilii TaxID=2304606 RepID=UPI0019222DBE|nr:SLAP domain-containing protein [Companilactobacillus zhachilii]MBL3531382.1 SLAP domain-containing protein [Companilactobacillus zhachilii]